MNNTVKLRISPNGLNPQEVVMPTKNFAGINYIFINWVASPTYIEPIELFGVKGDYLEKYLTPGDEFRIIEPISDKPTITNYLDLKNIYDRLQGELKLVEVLYRISLFGFKVLQFPLLNKFITPYHTNIYSKIIFWEGTVKEHINVIKYRMNEIKTKIWSEGEKLGLWW